MLVKCIVRELFSRSMRLLPRHILHLARLTGYMTTDFTIRFVHTNTRNGHFQEQIPKPRG